VESRSPSLPDAQEQARRFARVRAAHRTEMQEDYVELIGDLIAATGEARAADLAERFGVTAATVANTLARLKRDGLIQMQPYRSIFLTPKGKAMAASSRKRHAIVVDFLLNLGVSRETAETDAEGLEHHLSEETLRAMQDFGVGKARRAAKG
jgi:DtxR family manganese transport transcriptional regulator